MIRIANTTNRIVLDNVYTHYAVKQSKEGTRVYDVDSGRYLHLAHPCYSLACLNPLSGIPGVLDFERDFKAAIGEPS